MKRLLLFCFLFTSLIASAQKIPDMGLNRIRLIEPDKTILFETNPVSGEPELGSNNMFYWYGSNTIHATQGAYSGRLLNGPYNEFYLNKNLKVQGSFRDGLKQNAWKEFTEAGALIRATTWRNGVRSGKFSEFDTYGNLKKEGTYRNGLLNGEVYQYRTGDSVEIVKYKDGKIVPLKRSLLKRVNIFRKKSAKDSVLMQRKKLTNITVKKDSTDSQ